MTESASVTINPEKTVLLHEFKHGRPLTACYWGPDSRFVFFGAEDNFVHRYDLTNQSLLSLAAHESWIRSFGSSPDGNLLITGGYDGRLVWWPAAAEQPEPIRVLDAHQGWIRALAVSPDGRLVASCGNDMLVKIWDALSGSLIQECTGHQSHVYNVVFLPGSSEWLSCDLKGNVLAWELAAAAPREVATVAALHKYDEGFRADIGGARCMALRSDGVQLALGGITNVSNAFAGVGEVAIALVDVAGAKLDLLLETQEKSQGTAWGVAHHPEGFWVGLSGGGSGGWLWFWRGDAAHEFFKLRLKSDGRGMSLSPDRTQVAVAHADMHLRTYALHGD
ncbi:MAG: hypothetical protein KF861_09395 [Planctomycetaceae bacterium]|nr:hypothetical protein [Planctomycetaceae bacterium]